MGQTHLTAEAGSLRVDVTREFAAPRELVYWAYTDPELLVRWLGPRQLSMTVEQWDLRHGGAWRYVSRDPDGNVFAFRGVFHGEPAMDRLIQTFEFEGFPGHVSLGTASFDDIGGATRVRIETVFQSLSARDGMLASGMEAGMNEGWDRLDALVAQLANPA